jgi:hyperpolarization activated cyclic nucleotide-gated potassium channel 1
MFEVYGKENDVPPNLLGEISNFLSSNSDVTVLDENDKKELLMSVPKRFRLRIAMSFHQSAANVIDFIKLQDKSFVANIVPQMSYRKYKADTFVYSKGDIADEIYFMFEGKVNYTIGKKLVCFKSMVTGSYFGEIEVID